MVVHDNVDPIVTGINPTVVTLDRSGTMMMPHQTAPSLSETTVGGNVLRYPLAEGFDLDYTVTEVQLKQNLVVRGAQYCKKMLLLWCYRRNAPTNRAGYSSGTTYYEEEITQTQEELTIRNLETGEV